MSLSGPARVRPDAQPPLRDPAPDAGRREAARSQGSRERPPRAQGIWRRLRVRHSLAWAALGGLALLVGLVLRQGVGEILALLGTLGWGVIAVVLFHLVPMTCDALGWRRLLPRPGRLPIRKALKARWMGEAVNGLLPVAQVGGEFVKARYARQQGVPGGMAGASVVVDLTLGVFTQILFTLLGLGLLLLRLGGGQIAVTAALGAAFMAALLASFYAAQRRGLFSRLVGGLGLVTQAGPPQQLAASAHAVEEGLGVLYGDRRSLGVAAGWRLAGWLLGTGEIWLASLLLGHPLGLADALLLESLAQAVRASAFLVPAALGIQEGGYLLLGSLLGLDASLALSLALVRRARELGFGLPGLLVWQGVEGRRWWRRRQTA